MSPTHYSLKLPGPSQATLPCHPIRSVPPSSPTMCPESGLAVILEWCTTAPCNVLMMPLTSSSTSRIGRTQTRNTTKSQFGIGMHMIVSLHYVSPSHVIQMSYLKAWNGLLLWACPTTHYAQKQLQSPV